MTDWIIIELARHDLSPADLEVALAWFRGELARGNAELLSSFEGSR